MSHKTNQPNLLHKHTESTLIVDTVFSTFSSKDLKLGEFLWGQEISHLSELRAFKQAICHQEPPNTAVLFVTPACEQEAMRANERDNMIIGTVTVKQKNTEKVYVQCK